ncbi:sulfatase-like hydrolase/transferase [Pseudocolwellia agarivorans]|uniref:sulfatase-like hydrolase/transferase n=1 Tax=Pseudocolwellia agarivorans TaxID=1911682 RepID=UPI00158D4579|nr:sulfatase-like hydrolase/transferase [Pseudocolwellia agarivorans]
MEIIVRIFLLTSALLSGLFAKNSTAEVLLNKPNVIVIIADDAGFGDVGYNGSEINTPTLDDLANNAVRLDQFYTYATCTPSRAAFFTGQAPSKFGLLYPILKEDKIGLPKKRKILPAIFKENGYQTALIGKWHLGEAESFTPLDKGFDYHYGIRGGWIDYYTHHNPEHGHDWYRNNKQIKLPKVHATDLITQDAIRYLDDVNKDKPFFLTLSYNAPHVPIQVDAKWTKPYEKIISNKVRQGYAGMMTQLDDSVRQIINKLEKSGELNNTLIVFFSDNGPSAPGKKWYIEPEFHTINFYGNDGVYGATGGYRGWKAHPYDGSMRTPAFIYWPNKIAKRQLKTPIIIQDLYRSLATLVNLSGLPIVEDGDGRDMSETFTTGIYTGEPKFYWRTAKHMALRLGEWKLVIHEKTPYAQNMTPELYNVAVDAGETRNLAANEPAKLAELLNVLQQEFDKDPEPYVNPILLIKGR